MSVIVTVRLSGDPKRLEEYAAANPDAMRAIAERAKENGAIAHRFYGSDDDRIMVADEWPDAETFERFFAEARGDIDAMFTTLGIGGEAELAIWRKLETHDEFGWGA
jgi:hypothetical protein